MSNLSFNQLLQSDSSDDDNDENDDLIAFQFESQTINIFYSQISKACSQRMNYYYKFYKFRSLFFDR